MTPFQKSVAASVLLGLAFMQLLAMSFARGWIGGARPLTRGRLFRWHRIEGYVGLVIILVIAYYCTQLVPGSIKTARVYIHVLLGVTVIGLVISKVLIMQVFRRYYSRMPLLGVALLAAIIAVWISSAGWYFLTQPGGY